MSKNLLFTECLRVDKRILKRLAFIVEGGLTIN
jgi:hypothetical protein